MSQLDYRWSVPRGLLLGACAAWLAAGCATAPMAPRQAAPTGKVEAGSVRSSLVIDPAVGERILALDPERITEQDVRTALAAGPTPRIMLIHGGVYGTHLVMATFARFLVDLGYPQAKIRDPANGEYSYSPYSASDRTAGAIAWYYEHDGVRPMLIGHSQGGIQAVKILYELAGSYRERIAVWNPVNDAAEDRFAIVDPLTSAERPVVGVSVAYTSVVAAGGAALLLPNQWSMMTRLHTIPDTVEEFTGYSIDIDLVAWNFFGAGAAGPFRHNGTAEVRNIRLPAAYNHVFVPLTRRVADDPKMREWLNAYVPGADNGEPPSAVEGPDMNALWTADVWFSIKKHWCLEAQRLIRARRAAAAG